MCFYLFIRFFSSFELCFRKYTLPDEILRYLGWNLKQYAGQKVDCVIFRRLHGSSCSRVLDKGVHSSYNNNCYSIMR